MKNARKAKKGQSLAEYGLILALVAVVCIGGLTLMGGQINTALKSVAGQVSGAINGAKPV